MKNPCENCIGKNGCILSNWKDCPCRTCILSMICSQVCYERYVYGAKNLGFSDKYLSEENFENVGIKTSLEHYMGDPK